MKTVLITGASGGIGSACAELFAQNGYKVLLHYCKNEKKALELKEALNAEAFCADVSKPDEVKAMIGYFTEKAGKIDVVINNAGLQHIGMLCDMSFDDWKRILDVNLTGVYNVTREVISEMMFTGGKIINISSVWGQTGGACEAAYSASKAGIIGLTKSLAKEYSSINVNCVCPGVIKTPMNDHLSDEEQKELLEEIPLKRFGTPLDVAELCLFLSEKGDYITGQVIAVNGGMYI